jgi:hypothetical protein
VTVSLLQVHRATLLDGTVVAVKVQHMGMEEILRSDVYNTHKLCEWLKMLEPDLEFHKVCVSGLCASLCMCVGVSVSVSVCACERGGLGTVERWTH